LGKTIERSFDRDDDWIEYHAETLAELVELEKVDAKQFDHAAGERKAVNLWQDGYPDKAIAKLEKLFADTSTADTQTRGWLLQLAGRIAHHWGHSDRAEDFQRDAYARNRNLLRPKVLPPYRALALPSAQSDAIAKQIAGYRMRRGLLQFLKEVVANLHSKASSNQFEQALADFATLIGITSERHDFHGQGPDVLWLLPPRTGWVIEAKSRKNGKNPLNKDEHGQVLVAEEWFEKNYKGYNCIRVSVHAENVATKAAAATATYVLTYESLAALVSDARVLLTSLCESQIADRELVAECAIKLDKSPIKADNLKKNYLKLFVEQK
jgi:hypothetical protein